MQKITKNVAKLLILLENLPISQRYGKVLTDKMGKDYNYVIRLLDRMIVNKWVIADKVRTKKYYFITPTAPLKEAKLLLSQQPNNEKEEQVTL